MDMDRIRQHIAHGEQGSVRDFSLALRGLVNLAGGSLDPNLGGITDPVLARSNLGLGSASTRDAAEFVAAARSIMAGAGLVGGGSLENDLTISLSEDSAESLALANSAVQPGNQPAVGLYDTFAQAEETPVPALQMKLWTAGYYEPGDGGGGEYHRVSLEPAHGGKLQKPDGSWWELVSQRIRPRMLGAIEDGASDDTAALQAAFDVAQGRTLIFTPGVAYRYDPDVGLTINGPITIIASGAKFRELTASTDFSVFFLGDYIQADRLHFEYVGSGSSAHNQMGLRIEGSHVLIGEISVVADNPRTGANGNTRNAVVVGPDAAPRCEHVTIGRIIAKNWDRPIVFQNLRDWQVGRVDVSVYRRGVYILDCQNGEILGGSIKEASESIRGRAGENGVLISASVDYGTQDIRLCNIAVENSGEHGFRIGGQVAMRNIWHIACSAKESGLGYGTGVEPDDHGGCGFKALGPTSQYGYKHEGLYYIDCLVEQAIAEPGRGLNFCGFYLGKVRGAVISNPIVRPPYPQGTYDPATVHSSGEGMVILGCEDVTVTNPNICNPQLSGILIYAYPSGANDWGKLNNVKVIGGTVRDAGGAAILAWASQSSGSQVSVQGLLVENCAGGALEVREQNGGAWSNCSADFTVWNTPAPITTDADNWLISARGDLAGNLDMSARCGSTFHDWSERDGTLYLKTEAGWSRINGSLTVEIEDDGVFSWPTAEKDQWVLIAAGSADHYGQAWVNPIATPASVKVAGGANFEATAGALTGTTGDDGNLTVGAQQGQLFVENRTGETRTVTVTPIG